MDMNLNKLHEREEDRGAWRAAVHGVSKWLNNSNWCPADTYKCLGEDNIGSTGKKIMRAKLYPECNIEYDVFPTESSPLSSIKKKGVLSIWENTFPWFGDSNEIKKPAQISFQLTYNQYNQGTKRQSPPKKKSW